MKFIQNLIDLSLIILSSSPRCHNYLNISNSRFYPNFLFSVFLKKNMKSYNFSLFQFHRKWMNTYCFTNSKSFNDNYAIGNLFRIGTKEQKNKMFYHFLKSVESSVHFYNETLHNNNNLTFN